MPGTTGPTTRDPNPARRKKRPLQWFWYPCLTLLALAMVVGLVWALWYGTARAELNRAIAAARSRGEKVYFSEFKPPAVRPEQDGWPLVAKAIAQFSKPRAVTSEVIQRDEEAEAAFKRGQEIAWRGDANGVFLFDLPMLADEVALNSEALLLLDRALEFPTWQFPVGYDDPRPILTSGEYASGVNYLARFKTHVFLLAVNDGDVAGAFKALRDQFRIAAYLRDPPLEQQLRRINCADRAIASLRTALGRYAVSEDDLAKLDDDLQTALSLNGLFKQSMLSERGVVLSSLPAVVRDDDKDTMWLIAGDKGQYYLSFRRQPQLLRDQAYLVGFVSQLAESIGEHGPDRQAIRELCGPKDIPQDNILVGAFCRQHESALMAGVRHRQALLNARIGLRVARHYWANGTLPETLEEVLDEELPKLPVCLYSNKPLVYKKRSDGFAVYCLGDNGVDDGGGRKPDEQEGGSVFDVVLAPLVKPVTLENVEPPPEISADEPLIKEFSLPAAAKYLDAAALSWQKKHQCTSCHTMFSYMMARPALTAIARPMPEVRQFFEEIASGQRDPMPNYQCDDVQASVAIGLAASLALNDRLARRMLGDLTRQSLDKMWGLQRADGGWTWPFRDTPPIKGREHYGVTLAAIAAGMAPEDYAKTDAAQKGLALVRKYLEKNPPETLHEEAMLLWASSYVPDLAMAQQREGWLKNLLAAQRPDGGWSLASFVENPLAPPTASAEAAARLRSEPGYGIDFLVCAGRDAAYKSSLASDGYATGLAVLVARQAGERYNYALQRGIEWLKANQRVSGRWFTPSQSWHTQNLIANAGTAYAVLALHACGEIPGSSREK